MLVFELCLLKLAGLEDLRVGFLKVVNMFISIRIGTALASHQLVKFRLSLCWIHLIHQSRSLRLELTVDLVRLAHEHLSNLVFHVFAIENSLAQSVWLLSCSLRDHAGRDDFLIESDVGTVICGAHYGVHRAARFA